MPYTMGARDAQLLCAQVFYGLSLRGVCAFLSLHTHTDDYASHKIEYSDLELELTTEGAGNPARYAVFNMSISVKADLSEEHYKGLVDECNRCFVGNTMTHQPEIKIDIKTV